ncbi:bidirectional sugar transporter SWEET17-like [Olea europaea var. sylvestris]|uniref:Bidirectional sugar transporter SWEET n=1 Tax=Olea europaea subsp. europaea TaxID=158383 RepID=A0A8S0PU67_OLEEU|nr:bidirectional sugar transporter SWEET17-like [Olea europaea var. sylvestris]CAA2955065.1 bidirectional sugar transporter SWEET17-like [Olea europaea subsp. europaea]
MEALSFFVGIIGNIISILMFLSPAKTFWRIVKDRSTQEFESLPYICTLLGSSLWTYYGIIKPDSYLVATVNGFGVVVETVYVFLFLVFAPPKNRAKTAILAAILDVGFLAAAIAGIHFLLQGDIRIDVTGIICSGLNVIMYGSPLAAMKNVVTMKSVEYMPFLLSFFLFLNGGIWTLYACLVNDWFLGVPNAIGFVLGTSQLVLYAIYRNPKASKKIAADLEDGRQRKPLLSNPEEK